MKKLIAQGAEAKIYRSDREIIKERIKKNYRLPEIDLPLRTRRTRREASLLSKSQRAGISVPRVISIEDKTIMHIEFLDGPKVRDYLNKTNAKKLSKEIASLVTKMHSADIVHSDLTTSNMIFKDKIYFIDFGLGEFSKRVEDKAIDIHLFKECLVSKHHDIWEVCWKSFVNNYKNKEVLERLRIVESRGRYKKL